jgi:uncharacterized membrane-anchored protein YhcB (DUF1043 family)
MASQWLIKQYQHLASMATTTTTEQSPSLLSESSFSTPTFSNLRTTSAQGHHNHQTNQQPPDFHPFDSGATSETTDLLAIPSSIQFANSDVLF